MGTSTASTTGSTLATQRNSTENILDTATGADAAAPSAKKPITATSGSSDSDATGAASVSYVPVYLSDGTVSTAQRLGPNSAKSTVPGALGLALTLIALVGYGGLW